MADEETKPAVTDSRFPGFNPEVEASKAEAASAAAARTAAGSASATQPPPPPTYSHRCAACGALYEKAVKACQACGSAELIEAL